MELQIKVEYLVDDNSSLQKRVDTLKVISPTQIDYLNKVMILNIKVFDSVNFVYFEPKELFEIADYILDLTS